MASGRFLSTSIAEDGKLGKLSITAELLYLKTIPHLDRDGMISGRAGLLWGRVCPLREDLIAEMQKAIDEWITVELVIRMTTDDGPVLFFPGFLKNNNLLHYDRERPSRFPVPPGYERTDTGLILEGIEPKKKAVKKQKPSTGEPPQGDGTNKVQDALIDEVQDFLSQEEEQEEVKDQVKDQSQVEVKGQAQGVRTALADVLPHDEDDPLDPKALIADLRQRQFAYMDKNATTVAAKLIADYDWDSIMEAADKAELKHKEKIDSGEHGIIAPMAYIRSILAGTGNGTQQPRGVSPPVAQSMGEVSVDKFLARVNGKGH